MVNTSTLSNHTANILHQTALDCPRIAHTASGAFLCLMIPENRVESVQGHLRAIERVLG